MEILSITNSAIELSGITIRDKETVQAIMDICHKWKHLYKDGYPCGRKTRKKQGLHFEKWANSPGLCLSYIITESEGQNLKIEVLASNTTETRQKYSKEDIDFFKSMYIQEVGDEIAKTFAI